MGPDTEGVGHTCVWQAHNPEACGQSAVALVYTGHADHVDYMPFYRPLCQRHLVTTTDTFRPNTVPLRTGGGTWVVALRALPVLAEATA